MCEVLNEYEKITSNSCKRYLQISKVYTKSGNLCPKDTGSDLTGNTDLILLVIKIDQKRPSGSCQFLGRRLITRISEKYHAISTSTAKKEYIAAVSCCSQIL